MLLKYVYDVRLAQASYVVGCQATGEAVVIDPAREIAPYQAVARAEGLTITHVTETHIHADFVSGARELAAATGARLYLSAAGGADWQYADPDAGAVRLHDGDHFHVGRVRLEVVHTPGHTPEHVCFVLTDTAAADRPMGIFTGDCLFVGALGRPDLLELAVGVPQSAVEGARQQFQNVQRLKTMPDYLQVWPGHGAGSACGKGLGSVPSSTLGYEKLFNKGFQFGHESAFVEWLLADQPLAPRYFGQMKRANQAGPALLGSLVNPVQMGAADLERLRESALVIDTRDSAAFARQHAPGTINVPVSSTQFNTYAGYYVDYGQPTYVLVEDAAALAEVLGPLRAIGVDDVPGYFTVAALAGYTGTVTQIDPVTAAAQLAAGAVHWVDVRGTDEYAAGHVAGALHVPMGAILTALDDLPRDRPLVLQCGGGVRSQVVASVLLRAGFRQVLNLAGGMDGYRAAGLAVE
jgi:hydroxyacylglutathione hydrolase